MVIDLNKRGEKRKPHPYQVKATKLLIKEDQFLLLLDPGLGKTSIVLDALLKKFTANKCKKVLVIAPLRVCTDVWPAEVAKWSDFQKLKIVVLHGPKKDKLLDQSDAHIYVINPEGLSWLFGVTKTKYTDRQNVERTRVALDERRLKSLGFDLLVIDELTMFKNHASDLFKIMKLFRGAFKVCWGLTGSPAANGLINLFGQVYAVDKGRTFGQYITTFRNKYFTQPPYNRFSWEPRDEHAERAIYKALAPISLRMSAEDYLKLPELVENNIKIDLPTPARKIYDAVEDDYIAKIDDRIALATNAVVSTGKLRQVANGCLYLDPEVTALGFKILKGRREWAELHDAKINALLTLIDELQGNPLLVAYEFGHDLARIQAAIKDVPHIGGGVSTKRGSELAKLWNEGKLPVLLGNPSAMARGLNLQEVGHHICWFSLTWDFELYDQFIARVRRQGNKSKRVFVHHLLMRDTIDEDIYYRLRAKNKTQQDFFIGVESARRRASSRRNL